ncbi:MAG: hypothetical protein DME18_11765 [Verrucomicrobia bacterium]|nr:MAG: hypothetical protein DME18_11765 [Verrucomicrobiota bacterium]
MLLQEHQVLLSMNNEFYTKLDQREERNKAKQKVKKKAHAEAKRASMKYRGLINVDFTDPNGTEYQKLVTALIQAGWVYIETSALQIEGELKCVLQVLEIVARQCQDAGVLSALTIHVQGSSDFKGVPYPGARNHPHALKSVLAMPLPSSAP